jgi:DNA-binding NarL/FixJ family response regulator
MTHERRRRSAGRVSVLARRRPVGKDQRSRRPAETWGGDSPVFVRVAIADPLPIFRRGLRAVLGEAGIRAEIFDMESPDDLRDWLTRDEHRVVLLTVQVDADWDLLADLGRSRPGATLVAVLPEPSTGAYVRAVRAGAAVAVGRAAEPGHLGEVVRAAATGLSLLPVDVIRALASDRAAEVAEPGVPSDSEVAWLRQLAHGGTVGDLARRAGYSERMMFRLLRDLYAKLGVANRAEALFRAHERGWV